MSELHLIKSRLLRKHHWVCAKNCNSSWMLFCSFSPVDWCSNFAAIMIRQIFCELMDWCGEATKGSMFVAAWSSYGILAQSWIQMLKYEARSLAPKFLLTFLAAVFGWTELFCAVLNFFKGLPLWLKLQPDRSLIVYLSRWLRTSRRLTFHKSSLRFLLQVYSLSKYKQHNPLNGTIHQFLESGD